MSEETLAVKVRLIDARLAQVEARRTSKAISGIGSSAKKADEETKGGFLSGMSDSVKSLIGMAGVTGLAFGLKDVTEAGLNLQASQVQVQNALRNAGIKGKAAYKSIEDQMESLSEHGGGTVEQMNSGMAQFVSESNSVTQAQRAQRAAVQLSIKTGLSYSQTESMMSGALAGRTRGLQKYLGMIEPVKTAEEALYTRHALNMVALDQEAAAMGSSGSAWLKQEEILHGVTPQMSANAAEADKVATANKVLAITLQKTANAHESMQQKVQDMRHSFENLEANIGLLLIPVMKRLVDIADKVAAFLAKHKTLAIALFAAISALGAIALGKTLMGGLRKVMGMLKIDTLATRLFGTASAEAGAESAEGAAVATEGWKLFATTTLIGILFVALILLITHFKQVKAIALDVWRAVSHAAEVAFNFIKQIVNTVFTWIKGHWMLLVGILTGPFGLAVAFIVSHFTDIKNGVMSVVHFIERIATKIYDALTYPFRKAFGFIKGILGGIGGALHSIPLIGGLFHEGGAVHRAHGGPIYRAIGGPSGSDTVPAWLTPGEFVLNRSVVQQLGVPSLQSLNGGGGFGGQQQVVIEPHVTSMKLTDKAGRILAEAVTQYTLRRAARGPSSAIGGSLATNVVG